MEVSGQKVDQNEEKTFFQWKTKKESRLIKGKAKEITVTVREKITDKVESLIDKFCQEMQRFKSHIYNITNQLNHYRAVKENLKKTEALIHIDFFSKLSVQAIKRNTRHAYWCISKTDYFAYWRVLHKNRISNLLRCIRFFAT